MDDTNTDTGTGYTVLVGKGGTVVGMGGMPETMATGLLEVMSNSPHRPTGTLLDCCRDADAVDRGAALAARSAAADNTGDGARPTLGGMAAALVGDAAAALARRLGR
jgi:hypothetical protein